MYHNGAVACAVTPENEVLLVKQFRKPAEKPLLEIPAGKLEKAKNEKKQQNANYKKKQVTLHLILNSLQICMVLQDFQAKIINLFHRSTHEGEMNLDEDEFVELHKVSIENVKAMLENKELEDAKTIIALQHLLLNYNHSK